MRRLALAVLALSLAAGTAHADVPFKLQVAVRLDALRSRLMGKPRRYQEGSIKVDEKTKLEPGGGSTTTTDQYYIGYRGDVMHLSREIRHRDLDLQTTKLIQDQYVLGDRTTTTMHGDGSRTQEYTSFSGEGNAHTPRQTVTRHLVGDGTVQAASVLNHRTGERESRVYDKDGVKRSVTRDRSP